MNFRRIVISNILAVITVQYSWADVDRCSGSGESCSAFSNDKMANVLKCQKEIATGGQPHLIEAMLSDTNQHSFGVAQKLDFAPRGNPLPAGDILDLKGDGSTCQEMKGFGFSLTESSSIKIKQLSPEYRRHVIEKLFSKSVEGGSRFSYIILPLSSNDLSDSNRGQFTVCDCNENEDKQSGCFHPDRISDEMDILRDANNLNPELRVMLLPWTPPPYMKKPNVSRPNPYFGGNYLKEWTPAYAKCLARSVDYVEKHGIKVQGIGVQNEPGLDLNYPSVYMDDGDHAELLSTLQEELAKLGRHPQIVVRADNFVAANGARSTLEQMRKKPDHPVFAAHCYSNDPESAFQIYGNNSTNQTDFCATKDNNKMELMMAECSGSGKAHYEDFNWWINNRIFADIKRGSSAVLGWNGVLGNDFGPHNGPQACPKCRGLFTIDNVQPGAVKAVENPELLAIKHVSAFVQPGAVKVNTPGLNGVNSLVFRNPDGTEVALLRNESSKDRTIQLVTTGCKRVNVTLPSGAVETVRVR